MAVGVMRSRQVMTGAVVDFGGVVAGQGHLESFRYPLSPTPPTRPLPLRRHRSARAGLPRRTSLGGHWSAALSLLAERLSNIIIKI